MKSMSFLKAVLLAAVAPLLATAAEPVLISSFPLGQDAGKCGLRLGDLDGDGLVEFVMARQIGGEHQQPCLVHRLTAYDFWGKQLWQVGNAQGGTFVSFSDLPLQVADIDGDGSLEVIVVMAGADGGKQIQVRHGATGQLRRSAPIPQDQAHDAITLADLDGIGRPSNIVLKDRYKNLWALNADLSLRFQFGGNLGHYVRAFDIDNDGADELLAGYQCLQGNGKVAWQLDRRTLKLGAHADAIWVADVDGVASNGFEIAMADESTSAWLFHADGTLRWRYQAPQETNFLSHSQHVVAGELRADSPGLECVFFSRDTGHVIMLSAAGTLLAQRGGFDRIAILDLVPNWDGRGGNHIAVYRDGPKGLVLLDGNLETAVSFPRAPNGSKAGGEFFLLQADLCGDKATEIILYDAYTVAVYSHRPADPKARRTGKPRPQTITDMSWTAYTGGVTPRR